MTYRLYNTAGTSPIPATTARPVATLTYDPGTKTLGDMSGNFGTPQNSTDANSQDCATDPGPQRVGRRSAPGLSAGFYRLNVEHEPRLGQHRTSAPRTCSPSGSGRQRQCPRLRQRPDGGLHQPRCRQPDVLLLPDRDGPRRQDAGDRAVRPGRVVGQRVPPVPEPGRRRLHLRHVRLGSRRRSERERASRRSRPRSAAPPSSTTTSSRSPSTCRKNYGKNGLNPPGDITDEEGWWQIEYNINAANDTTTWSVSIRGNPVHLILPT